MEGEGVCVGGMRKTRRVGPVCCLFCFWTQKCRESELHGFAAVPGCNSATGIFTGEAQGPPARAGVLELRVDVIISSSPFLGFSVVQLKSLCRLGEWSSEPASHVRLAMERYATLASSRRKLLRSSRFPDLVLRHFFSLSLPPSMRRPGMNY